MFTGIIDHSGTIEAVQDLRRGKRLHIRTEFVDLSLGESIAVDGICLTVSDYEHHQFQAELSHETLAKTIAPHYQPGQRVNLERALCIGDRLGGHFVSGHVDQTATVKTITAEHDFHHWVIGDFTHQQQGLLIEKGSITINGVSLTLNAIHSQDIEILLVPHTLQKTSLSQLSEGQVVNIEFDLLAKIILKQTRGLTHAESI